MIFYHLKELIHKKSVLAGRRITYSEIAQETGLSRITLARMGAVKKHRVNLDAIEKLCHYFQCSFDDLMTIIPDPPSSDEPGKMQMNL